MDSGNLFFKHGSHTSKNMKIGTANKISDQIATAYQAMGYDALLPSSFDLQGGFEFLQNDAVRKLPLLAANVVDENQKPIFPAYLHLKKNGVTVGIIGITDQQYKPGQGLKILDWKPVLQKQIVQLEGTADLLILLTSLPQKTHQELLILFPELDVILSADSRRSNIKLSRYSTATTLLTQAGSRGKFLGKLDILWNKGDRWSLKQTIKHPVQSIPENTPTTPTKKENFYANIYLPINP